MLKEDHKNQQLPLFGHPNNNNNLEDKCDLKKKILILPKVELHRHLSGAIRSSTAQEILSNYDIKLKNKEKIIKNIDEYITLTEPVKKGLEDYVKPFRILSKLFVNQETTSRITFEAIEDAYKDNIVYLELRSSARGYLRNSLMSLNEFYEGILDGIMKAESLYPIITKLIVSINRQALCKFTRNRNIYLDRIFETSLYYRRKLIVGFDLSGVEVGNPPTLFTDFFIRANKLNYKITIHAGEFGNGDNIEKAISELHSTRIGHGINAKDSPYLIKEMIERNITVESCITSNIISNAVTSIEQHPIKKFINEGVNVVLCTDNPRVHKISLTDEYLKLIESFSFDIKYLKRMTNNSIPSLFCEEETKGVILERLRGG